MPAFRPAPLNGILAPAREIILRGRSSSSSSSSSLFRSRIRRIIYSPPSRARNRPPWRARCALHLRIRKRLSLLPPPPYRLLHLLPSFLPSFRSAYAGYSLLIILRARYRDNDTRYRARTCPFSPRISSRVLSIFRPANYAPRFSPSIYIYANHIRDKRTSLARIFTFYFRLP